MSEFENTILFRATSRISASVAFQVMIKFPLSATLLLPFCSTLTGFLRHSQSCACLLPEFQISRSNVPCQKSRTTSCRSGFRRWTRTLFDSGSKRRLSSRRRSPRPLKNLRNVANFLRISSNFHLSSGRSEALVDRIELPGFEGFGRTRSTTAKT